MLALPGGVRIHVCTRPTDMRKSFNGLIALTRTVLKADPLSGHLFIFVNRKADYLKALYWSRGGCFIWSKRLEAGRFAAFTHADGAGNSTTLTDTELSMWLDGIELTNLRKRKRFELPCAPGAG